MIRLIGDNGETKLIGIFIGNEKSIDFFRVEYDALNLDKHLESETKR